MGKILGSLGIALWIFSPPFGWAETLIMGVYTSDKLTTMYQKFKPILNSLEQELSTQGISLNFKLKIFPSYSKGIDALVTGKCDLARFGPASYILAKEQNPNIRLLVMEQKKGSKSFKGHFITRKDSSINSIQDLKGKSFAFGDKNSTIGRFLAQAELVKANIRSNDLTKYSYLGRHDKVVLAVANGQYDGGIVKENTFRKYAESRGIKTIGHIIIATKPWIVKADFDENLYTVLQKTLLQLKDPKALKALGQDGVFPVSDGDYDSIRKAMTESKNFNSE